MVKRKTYRLRKGDVIDVEEFHDGNYGSPGSRRTEKKKATPEQVAKVNRANKFRRCRHRLLEYFNPGDVFVTLTYEVSRRPENMKKAVADFGAFRRVVAREYKKRGRPLFWIRNIEAGTRGAWHIHLVINNIGDTLQVIQQAWKHGGMYAEQIRTSDRLYDKDFTKLAAYMTKDENVTEKKKDGSKQKPRIKEANYSTSRNMPLPEPKVDKINRWKKEVRPKKGYYVSAIYEGTNPVTGFLYRRYTMVRLQ